MEVRGARLRAWRARSHLGVSAARPRDGIGSNAERAQVGVQRALRWLCVTVRATAHHSRQRITADQGGHHAPRQSPELPANHSFLKAIKSAPAKNRTWVHGLG